MKQIRVGVIGQGRSGKDIHGKYFESRQEKYKVVAVVDEIEARRKKAENIYGCNTYESYKELFDRDDLDLVVNASYSHMHVPITLELINRGFNVLCEKPLASRVEDVDLLIEASKKSGRLFAIFQQSRFAPYYRQVKKVTDSGVLGRIVQISIAFNRFERRWDWQTLKSYNGGSLLNTGPHPLDQALQFFGSDAMPKVTCIMDRTNTFGDAEDYVKILLTGKGRPVIDLEISSCCAYPPFIYHVQGTTGGLIGNMKKIDWKYFIPSETPKQELKKEPLKKEDGSPAYCSEKLKWYEEEWSLPPEQEDYYMTITSAFYEMLYRTLTAGAPLEITPSEVRQQIAVIEECRRQNQKL